MSDGWTAPKSGGYSFGDDPAGSSVRPPSGSGGAGRLDRATSERHCPNCGTSVVVISDPPAVIETHRAPLFYDPPVYFEHTSKRCRDVRDRDVPQRVLAAEDRRRFRQLLEDSSLGCPNTPRCGRMLVDHDHDGWDGHGGAINPRCPS